MGESAGRIIEEIYERLYAAYGPQHWWPGETPLEVVVGAILTQNTAWTNVERAIDSLRQAECLSWEKLHSISESELASLVRSAGTYRIKAKRLKVFVNSLMTDHGGSLETMLAGDLELARDRLLLLNGIGPETADAILLYAGGRPTFVVDSYTMRVLRRHLLIETKAGYESVRAMFMRVYGSDVEVCNEYHALLVRVCKLHCKARSNCEACPLCGLPHDSEL